MKIECGVTFLINRDESVLEIVDEKAGVQFFRARLTQEQVINMLSRLSHTRIVGDVAALEYVGKILETREFEFPLPKGVGRDKERAYQIACMAAPEGWIVRNYFGSQTSFFHKDDKLFARARIDRWGEPTEVLQ